MEDVNEFIPEWKERTYVAEVTEGHIEKRILQLDAADADGSEKFSKICRYHLLSTDVPFEISAEGMTCHVCDDQQNRTEFICQVKKQKIMMMMLSKFPLS